MNTVRTERDGDVLLVTLNRPDALNAINHQMLDDLKSAWDEAADPAVRAVVITGSGRGFCAGADLTRGASPTPGGLENSFNPHALALAALRKAVVCAVNGPAAGAGLSMACTGDIRIASEAATFVPAFSRIGFVPDSGASFLLTRILGYPRAFDFLCSGRRLDANEALAIGLVNEVVPAGQLLDRAMERAHGFAAMPGRAVELSKDLLKRAGSSSIAEMIDLESQYQRIATVDPDGTAARSQVAASLTKKVAP